MRCDTYPRNITTKQTDGFFVCWVVVGCCCLQLQPQKQTQPVQEEATAEHLCIIKSKAGDNNIWSGHGTNSASAAVVPASHLLRTRLPLSPRHCQEHAVSILDRAGRLCRTPLLARVAPPRCCRGGTLDWQRQRRRTLNNNHWCSSSKPTFTITIAPTISFSQSMSGSCLDHQCGRYRNP